MRVLAGSGVDLDVVCNFATAYQGDIRVINLTPLAAAGRWDRAHCVRALLHARANPELRASMCAGEEPDELNRPRSVRPEGFNPYESGGARPPAFQPTVRAPHLALHPER